MKIKTHLVDLSTLERSANRQCWLLFATLSLLLESGGETTATLSQPETRELVKETKIWHKSFMM